MINPSTDAEFPYRKSLDVSWKEGMVASFMQAIIDYYLIPLGLLLGARPTQIGLLVAIPNLLGAVTQLFAVEFTQLLGSHLRFLVVSSAVQAALILPICLLPVLTGIPDRVGILILLITFFRILANIIQTVWASLMSHYLPQEERGKYFGWRSQVCGFATIASVAIAGFILFLFRHWSPAAGFLIVFGAAGAARFASSHLMSKMEPIEVPHIPAEDFTFWKFIQRFRQSNFVMFTFFVSGIVFATNLAAPFFSVYILKELRFSYLQYLVMESLLIVTMLIGFPFWGHWADKVGNVKILKTTGKLIPIIPILWMVSKNFFYLTVIEMVSGFIWAGFNLCTVNFIYDAVSPAKRTRCLSYFYLLNGIAIFFGAALSGLIAEHAPKLFGSSILAVFLISGIFRALSFGILSRRFKEVRTHTQNVSSLELFFSAFKIPAKLGLGDASEINSLFEKPRWLRKN